MTFLVAYAVALVAAVVAGPWIKEVRGAGRSQPLSHEETGYLSGGPARAAEVAVAALVSENKARFADDRLVAVEPHEPADSPIGTVVQAQLGGRLDDVVGNTANSEPVWQLGHQLLADGLLVTPGQRARRAIAAVVPLLLLAVVLVLYNQWSVWTVGAAALTAAGIIGLLATPPPVLTRAGSQKLWEATIGLAPVEPAELTARYGLQRPNPRKAMKQRQGVQTATFDGHTVERFDAEHTSNEMLPRPRRSAVTPDQPPHRARRAAWAAGWFAGGWLASSWLSEGSDGDFFDTGFDSYGDA